MYNSLASPEKLLIRLYVLEDLNIEEHRIDQMIERIGMGTNLVWINTVLSIEKKINGTTDTDSEILSSILTRPYQSTIIISIGESWSLYKVLCDLPYDIRKRWIHFLNPELVNIDSILECWLSRPVSDVFIKIKTSTVSIERSNSIDLDVSY